ncbi:hypothetical protein APHAL10511_005425 [Amanita phalloides]|nr:hypothetical protein APHAL10511_005425 [Amanita phalloides]
MPPKRGSTLPQTRPSGARAAPTGTTGHIPDHVTAIGVKRPNFGTLGRPLDVVLNAYDVQLAGKKVYQYDVDIQPGGMPAKFNRVLVQHLQKVVAPEIFKPLAGYDGEKIMYSSHRLQLGDKDAQEFKVPSPDADKSGGKRPPKTYKIKLTKVSEINSEVLNQHANRKQSLDDDVLTVITALNVANRMHPSMDYPANKRAFFVPEGKKAIGGGFELRRGFFQSIRPGIGRILLNINIVTGVMYKPGPLVVICREYLRLDRGAFDPKTLSPPSGLKDADRKALERFISGIKVVVKTSSKELRTGTIKGISGGGADRCKFTLEGKETNVADHFKQYHNAPLRYPQMFCVQIGSADAMYPLELCVVPEGQLSRRQVPSTLTDEVVQFATLVPKERFEKIDQVANKVLRPNQSTYVEQFGMQVNISGGMIKVKARVLQAPRVHYGQKKLADIKDGAWNLMGKHFHKPETIRKWVVVIFGDRFSDQTASGMIKSFVESCHAVGIKVLDEQPIVKRFNGQGNISALMRSAGAECYNIKKEGPNLMLVVLPDGGDDIYKKVKYFGDIEMGVATQCVKGMKAARARPQYWANVLAKVNVKLGGRNHVLNLDSVPLLNDLQSPVIVMGADVMHPGPGSTRPSYTALVGSVDSLTTTYVHTMRAQTSRRELISDLQEMVKEALDLHVEYKAKVEKTEKLPKKLIFYRDGVSTGQFEQVIREELPMIRRACQEKKINPKITLVVVGKRHHFRFMSPQNEKGNTPAGTTVDTDITDPIVWDWYTQSHKPLLGTSRPAHYTVLLDENGFNSDSLQSFSNAMCHIYARSTGAVSIPAPVYYADIICARAPLHYAPGTDPSAVSDTATESSSEELLRLHKSNFKPLNSKLRRVMHFM